VTAGQLLFSKGRRVTRNLNASNLGKRIERFYRFALEEPGRLRQAGVLSVM
jgi:hypothetical protein